MKKRKGPFHHHSDQNYQKEREEKFRKVDELKQKKSKKIKIIGGSIMIILILIVTIWTYSYYALPGPYDNFAKCLSDKGAVMYGAISWCKYTQGQAAMFGKSFKYVNYHDESELEGIKTRPTWVINGKRYETVQSFQTLSSITNCKI